MVEKERTLQSLTLLIHLLAKKLAESISRKVSFENKGNPDSVLSLLRSYGFTDSQISSTVTGYPTLLVLDADKSLGPKLQFLQSRGGGASSSDELTQIVSTVPKLLAVKEAKAISRYYDFVKDTVQAETTPEFEKSSHSLLKGSKQENKMRNLSVLRDLGMPHKLLFSVLISDHGLVCGKERFEESLKRAVDMGFKPTTTKFIDALGIIRGFSDQRIKEKVNDYKRFGLSVGDVWVIFKKFPMFLGFSEKKIGNSFDAFLDLGFTRDEFTLIVKLFPQCTGCSTESVKNKTEFLVKNMKWPLKVVVSYPQVLGLSMEKRIVPRCNVIKALMSKGSIRTELSAMYSVLMTTDQAFLNKYVMKHNDKQLVPALIAIFTRNRVSLSDHLQVEQ